MTQQGLTVLRLSSVSVMVYYPTEVQAQAILSYAFKLTGLEHEKILSEYKELLDLIAELLYILASPERLMELSVRS